jgi:hypothetical protein
MRVDVVMDQVLIYWETTLLENVHGRMILNKSMRQLIHQVWKKQLGHALIFHILAQEWITFIFLLGNDKENIQWGKWY